MRFIFTSDILGSWARFGGISAQLNKLSITRRLPAAERIPTSLLYDAPLSPSMQELARSRAERSAAVIKFGELLPIEQTRF